MTVVTRLMDLKGAAEPLGNLVQPRIATAERLPWSRGASLDYGLLEKCAKRWRARSGGVSKRRGDGSVIAAASAHGAPLTSTPEASRGGPEPTELA